MNQSNQSKQVLLSVIGVAILVVAVVGVSFAFFNYTRTGTENTVSTGKIYFNHTQDGTAALTNVFPLTSAQLAADTAKANHAEVEIDITADTTYSLGLDYRLVATGVDFTATVDNVDVVVPVTVEVTGGSSLSTNGSFTSNYAAGNSTAVTEGSILGYGHVVPAADVASYTGSRYTGTVLVKVYIDASKIAITDTLENGSIAVSGYTNGTTGTPGWVNGRLRMTTAQWNSLTTDTLKFSIRVESKETGGNYAYSPS